MKPSIVVWDLETVRPSRLRSCQRSGRQVGRGGAGGDRRQVSQAHLPLDCLQRSAHRALGAGSLGCGRSRCAACRQRTEKQLIAAFCDKVAELSPQLVTFNGNSFDLPVLGYRAMIPAISAPGLSARPYFHRYTEDAIDLCESSRLVVKSTGEGHSPWLWAVRT